MQRVSTLVVAVFVAAACSDAGVSPTAPGTTVPTIRASHTTPIGGDLDTSDDLCGGLSPCDAFDYDRNGDGDSDDPNELTGVSGFCFLSPMVDNHLSDPACSGAFVPGLSGELQLAYCQVVYPPGSDPAVTPPTIVDGSCQEPAQWQDLVQDPSGGEFYKAEVQFKKNIANGGEIFRLYIVRNGVHFAHRDVVVDPNLTTPADYYVHSIGNGKEPVKLRITEGSGCVTYDTQTGGTDNAASCLIAGATSVPLLEGSQLTASFDFPDGNPAFFADFEISECSDLEVWDGNGDPNGVPLVDVPLADCKISLTSEQLDALTVPGEIHVTLTDPRWVGGVFDLARPNLLQYDEAGVGVLPPTPPAPGWLGTATSSGAFRLLGRGLKQLAAFLGVKPLYGPPSAGGGFLRLSDFQVAVMPVMEMDIDLANPPGDCATPADHCYNLGTFGGTAPVPVNVKVSAPDNTGTHTYPAGHIPVPYTRLHFFPATGTVGCPAGTLGPLDAYGRGCYPAGTQDESADPPYTWDHLVVVTGTDGKGSADWSLAGGSNTLDVVACGVARPGANEPDPPAEPGGDGVWGTLGDCSSRSVSAVGFDNGPADGFTPYEPVDTQNEAAIYGLPLTFEAETCPQIVVDGYKGEAQASPVAEWEACAEKTGFIAPLKGPKPSTDNAWLYTYNDADNLYVALEVASNDEGEKIFIHFVESFGVDGIPAAGNELIVLEANGTAGVLDVLGDWHFTQSCVDNNANSLCGDPDTRDDVTGTASPNPVTTVTALARANGAGGNVFYEFKIPLTGRNTVAPKEDLLVTDPLGLRLQVTQGQGGGKGGFEFPDPKTDGVNYHQFNIQ